MISGVRRPCVQWDIVQSASEPVICRFAHKTVKIRENGGFDILVVGGFGPSTECLHGRRNEVLNLCSRYTANLIIIYSWDSSLQIVKGLWARVHFFVGMKSFLSSTASRLVLGPMWPSQYRGLYHQRWSSQEQAVCSLPSNSRVTKAWSYTSIPPYFIMMLFLIEHKSSCSFLIILILTEFVHHCCHNWSYCLARTMTSFWASECTCVHLEEGTFMSVPKCMCICLVQRKLTEFVHWFCTLYNNIVTWTKKMEVFSFYSFVIFCDTLVAQVV
jgi:hypothetical protein